MNILNLFNGKLRRQLIEVAAKANKFKEWYENESHQNSQLQGRYRDLEQKLKESREFITKLLGNRKPVPPYYYSIRHFKKSGLYVSFANKWIICQRNNTGQYFISGLNVGQQSHEPMVVYSKTLEEAQEVINAFHHQQGHPEESFEVHNIGYIK
jgi:transposase